MIIQQQTVKLKENKMDAQRCVCTLDIKINKKLIKLPILKDDSLKDLVSRLCSLVNIKDSQKIKMSQCLEQQIKKLLTSESISNRIKKTLENIISNKIKILDSTEINRSLQTPFRVLQESIINAKKVEQKKCRRQFNYLDQYRELNCNLKYQSTPYDQQTKLPVNSMKMVHKLACPNNESLEYFERKYEAIDRKCQEFITKNIKKVNANDNNDLSPINYTAFTNQRQIEPYVKEMIIPNLQPPSQLINIDRKFSQLNLQQKQVINEQTSSFQQYKISKNKSQNILNNPINKYQQVISQQWPLKNLQDNQRATIQSIKNTQRQLGRKYKYLSDNI